MISKILNTWVCFILETEKVLCEDTNETSSRISRNPNSLQGENETQISQRDEKSKRNTGKAKKSKKESPKGMCLSIINSLYYLVII